MCYMAITSGHFLQHAFLSGRNASFSEHARDGHLTRGHLISKVFALHVHTVHVSNPFGGK